VVASMPIAMGPPIRCCALILNMLSPKRVGRDRASDARAKKRLRAGPSER
jgi:hypothetical protein